MDAVAVRRFFPSAEESFAAYSTFPEALYRRFLDRYVKPFHSGGRRMIDLGCGSGNLLRLALDEYGGAGTGVDISRDSIECCRKNRELIAHDVDLVQGDVLALTGEAPPFDLVVSYSVLHLVPGSTAEKFDLLRRLTRPGSLVALDALPDLPWNRVLFFFVRNAFRLGIGEVAVRLLGPWLAPTMPARYLEELSRLTYMKDIHHRNFLDLRFLQSEEFKRNFELLRLEIVAQDGPLTGRKARLTVRRK